MDTVYGTRETRTDSGEVLEQREAVESEEHRSVRVPHVEFCLVLEF